jgi:hypothetical protein
MHLAAKLTIFPSFSLKEKSNDVKKYAEEIQLLGRNSTPAFEMYPASAICRQF